MHYAKPSYIFIVKILYEANGSFSAYVMDILSFHDLFDVVSLLEAGFGLKGIILSPVHTIDEDNIVKETAFSFFFF